MLWTNLYFCTWRLTCSTSRYLSQLLGFSKSSLEGWDILLAKAGKARWAPHSARSFIPSTLRHAAMNFPFAIRNTINLLALSFSYQYLSSSFCIASFSLACVSTTFVEITFSKPFSCFAVPFLYSCHATNGCGLYRSQPRTILFPRVSTTGPLFNTFLNENTEGT